MKKRIVVLLLCLALLLSLTACGGKPVEMIPYWESDSPAMASLVAYVAAVSDEKSPSFVPEEERIAVFDMDGTLYGELFPTYFDECLLLHRLLHDESYEASPEDRAWAQLAETALLCDDTERDYGDPEAAASFAETCRMLGFETVSMRDEFQTIYKADAVKTALQSKQAA